MRARARAKGQQPVFLGRRRTRHVGLVLAPPLPPGRLDGGHHHSLARSQSKRRPRKRKGKQIQTNRRRKKVNGAVIKEFLNLFESEELP